jgi:hypothetical protein
MFRRKAKNALMRQCTRLTNPAKRLADLPLEA